MWIQEEHSGAAIENKSVIAGHGGIYLSRSTLEAEAAEALRSRLTWSTK